jgi:hypothetical protein
MSGEWVDALARALAWAQPRRGLLRLLAALLAVWGAAADHRLSEDAAAKRKSKRRRQKQQKQQKKQKKRRRRRRRRCKLLPSGAECSEGGQCCSGTCDENTAFPQFDLVCCQAQGASCVIGRNECCQDFACHCTTLGCVDFNGAAGVCG